MQMSNGAKRMLINIVIIITIFNFVHHDIQSFGGSTVGHQLNLSLTSLT